MFTSIINLFNEFQHVKDNRYNDFEKFYIECIKTFPSDLKKRLNACKIMPVKFDKKLNADLDIETYRWTLDFTMKDVFWWREKYNECKFTMKPIDAIKKEVMKECVDIISSTPISDLDDDLKCKIFDETLNGNVGIVEE